jgi:hypothetical protein
MPPGITNCFIYSPPPPPLRLPLGFAPYRYAFPARADINLFCARFSGATLNIHCSVADEALVLQNKYSENVPLLTEKTKTDSLLHLHQIENAQCSNILYSNRSASILIMNFSSLILCLIYGRSRSSIIF